MDFFKKIWITFILLYNYLKLVPQLVVGSWKITQLPQPVVSIFGGTRLKKDSPYIAMAEQLSQRLVVHGISVITGGGPGIMEAANCGAFNFKKVNPDGKPIRTMGIGVKGLTDKEQPNNCMSDYILTDYFEMRKYLLIYYSYAYVIFPGGFGTLDEFADVMTLMQAEKLKRAPIILFGKEYWVDFIRWIDRAESDGLILSEHKKFITVTDDIDQAVEILANYCKECDQ